MPNDERFICWFYEDPTLSDPDYWNEQETHPTREAGMARIRTVLGAAGRFKAAILTNEEWTEYWRGTIETLREQDDGEE